MKTQKNYILSFSIIVAAIILSGTMIMTRQAKTSEQNKKVVETASKEIQTSELHENVLPSEGVILPVVWGDLGVKLANSGVIDSLRFKAMYEQRGNFTPEYEKLLFGENNGRIKITRENAGYLLNLFWALGLGSKNPILEEGEMMNPVYGGAGRFASTAGWSISKGNPMDHYSRHQFFNLTSEQQALVDKISRGIYRPCCGNSTHFPDCNHGMAMLGLLELMASQDVSEEIMWKTALAVNSYWFPDTYMTIATYMQNRGTDWDDVNPLLVLGEDFSSASGFQRISAEVTPPEQTGGGGGCSV